ncbi:MAG: RNA methyltransferase [Clostridia bacterium]|nr:RNA methyltransferase [Clostridia bacterium]
MKEINSKDNRIFKFCSKLSGKKYRDSFGAYLIEGPNLIEEALRENEAMDALIYRRGYKGPLFEEKAAVELCTFDEKLFDAIAQTDTSQGVIAVVKKRSYKESEFFERCSEGNGNVLVLDRLQDPGNLGTLIRTADAAGYGGVMLLKGSGDVFSPKVVRAAAGSLFRVPLYFAESPEEAAGVLKRHQKKIVSTCFDTELYYSNVDLRKNIALVIGNEGRGICEEMIALSDLKIKIPMSGRIDSLNASVAGGILMYESMRN